LPKNRPEHRQAGFTLIEVIVALAIAALGLGMLMMATGTGLTNATAAGETIEATLRAQSHLAALGTLTPLHPGVQSGDDGGGYFWRVAISQPVSHASAADADETPPALYSILVTITWRSGLASRSVSLRTQRLGHTEETAKETANDSP
jgi:general secretion pathway protein I